MFHHQHVSHKWHLFVFFMSFPEPLISIPSVDSLPMWYGGSLIIFQLFRCRKLTFTRDIFSSFSLQACRGYQYVCLVGRASIHTPMCLNAPIHTYVPCMSISPSIHLYVPTYNSMFPYTSICSPYIMGTLGGPSVPQYIGQTFCVCQDIHLILSS